MKILDDISMQITNSNKNDLEMPQYVSISFRNIIVSRK